MSDLSLSIEEAITQAHLEGHMVVMGNDTTLLLDFDAPLNSKLLDAPREYYSGLSILHGAGIACTEVERWTSKSGRGLHIVLRLENPLPAVTRLAVQACLGSDLRRELLGVLRVLLAEVVEPSLLFKPRK